MDIGGFLIFKMFHPRINRPVPKSDYRMKIRVNVSNYTNLEMILM